MIFAVMERCVPNLKMIPQYSSNVYQGLLAWFAMQISNKTIKLQVQPLNSESNLIKAELSNCQITMATFSISDSHKSFWVSLQIKHLSGKKRLPQRISISELFKVRNKRDSTLSNMGNLVSMFEINIIFSLFPCKAKVEMLIYSVILVKSNVLYMYMQWGFTSLVSQMM